MLMRFRPRTQATLTQCLLGVWLFAGVQSPVHAFLLQLRTDATRSGPVAPQELSAHHHHEHQAPARTLRRDAAPCLKTCEVTKLSIWSVSPGWSPDLAWAPSPLFKPWPPLQPGLLVESFAGSAPPGEPPPSIRFLKRNR